MAEITLQESPRLKHLWATELNKQFKKGNICSSSGKEDIFDFRIALKRKFIQKSFSWIQFIPRHVVGCSFSQLERERWDTVIQGLVPGGAICTPAVNVIINFPSYSVVHSALRDTHTRWKATAPVACHLQESRGWICRECTHGNS